MNIYNENLRLLRKRYPYLADKVSACGVPSNLLVELARNKYPTIKYINKAGQHQYLHSAYNPINEAQALVRNMDQASLVSIVYGTGMGYHIMELINRGLRNKTVIAVEPEISLLKIFLNTNVATSFLRSQNCFLIAGKRDEINWQLNSIIKSSVNFKMSNLATLILPGYERVYGRLYWEIHRVITDYSKLRYMQYGNSAEDTLIGLKNNFLNLDGLLKNPGINQLKGKYKGIPAVIISAGPSLNKNINLLKDIKGKALLLCVDTVLKKVMDSGVIPDIVLSVERGRIVYDWFYKDLEVPEELYFVGLNVVDPQIFKKFGERGIVCFRDTEPLSRWANSLAGDKGCINAGMSVANLAFSVARLVESDPIVFVGQDLAYSEAGDSHVSGTAYDNIQRKKEPVVYVKDYQGNPIPSRDIWKKFLNWFEQEIAQTHGARVIDATEGGAYIGGTKVMKLREVIDEYIKGSYITPVASVLSDPCRMPEDAILSDTVRGIREMIQIIEKLTTDISQTVLPNLERVKEKLDCEFNELKVDLDQIEDDYNQVVLGFNEYPRSVIGFITQSIVIMNVYKLNNLGSVNTTEKARELVEILFSYYNNLIEIVDITRMMLEDFLDGIEKPGKDRKRVGVA